MRPHPHPARLARDCIRADLSRLERPLLCIVVDTEEGFDWNGPFSRRNTDTSSLAALPLGHAIFRRHGLQPTYLVDYPVIADPRARDILGPWMEANEAVVGAHLHPWVTPPFEEVVCPYNSFACNVAPELEQRKLALLTEAIRAALGRPPLIYKAGRYGLDIRREGMLCELGYRVDTSVIPFRDYSGMGGGPDFFGYPDQLFWANSQRAMLYMPVTHSVIGPLRKLAHTAIGRLTFSASAERLHLPGLLARLGLLERIMLTPEGTGLESLQRLTTALLASGYRVFTLSLHSPSFAPGGTPYVQSKAQLAAFLQRIEAFLDFFMGKLGGCPVNPLELAGLLGRPA